MELPLSVLLSATVREVPVERIGGTATSSSSLLSAELGDGTTLTREESRLRITREVEVLDRTLPVTAAGTVTLEGPDVVVAVEQGSGAGVDAPDWLLERAADTLDLHYPVPELPFGLQLTGVVPADGGVGVALEATDTVIAAGNT